MISCFFIPLIGACIHSFCISESIHQEDHFLFLDFLFLIHCFFGIFNDCATLCRIFLLYLIQIFYDHIGHRIIVIQDVLEFCNVFQSLFMFFHQSFDLQTNQLIQTHFKNRSRLPLCKPEHRSHLFGNTGLKLDILCNSFGQTCFCILDVLTSAQDFNNQIYDITCFDQTFLDLFFIPLFFQKCLILSGCHLKLKIHVMFNDPLKPHRFRSSVCYCKHIYSECIFQTRLFVKHIRQILYIRPFFQFNDNPDSFFG